MFKRHLSANAPRTEFHYARFPQQVGIYGWRSDDNAFKCVIAIEQDVKRDDKGEATRGPFMVRFFRPASDATPLTVVQEKNPGVFVRIPIDLKDVPRG